MSIIRDPLISPYSISIDSFGFVLSEDKVSESGKEYNIFIGHYLNLEGALKTVIRLKTLNKNKEYSSLRAYIDEVKELNNQIKTLI